MSLRSISLQCPGCGSPVSTDMETCPYCYGPIVITSFRSVYGMTAQQTNRYMMGYQKALSDHPDSAPLLASAAMCCLKLKLYEKAYHYFDQLLENNLDDSESFFYAAVCLLKGKRPFLQPLSVIKKVQELLDAAILIEDRGVYHLFLAYLKLDYFCKKSLRVSPSWQEELLLARETNLPAEDVRMLFELLHQDIPLELQR